MHLFLYLYTKFLYLFRNLLSLRPTNFSYCKSHSLPYLSVWSTPPPPPPPTATPALSSPYFLLFSSPFFIFSSFYLLHLPDCFRLLLVLTSALLVSSLFSSFVYSSLCDETPYYQTQSAVADHRLWD